ncbi:mitotic-spindle organizing protein 2 isoform X2 [Chaetodon trifascialis]|uniref:mitotic-spindle organizing protein 2 isoform X2 n=1 Tax=Chaetodon trifascialis TaxID=109706 RepID=UPI003994FBDA
MSQQAQQTVPSAPDSPALVVTSNVQKYAIKKKKVLSAEEAELFELTQAAGITVDQEVFKIIVDLLKMNVAPQAVFQTLKAMCAGQRVAESGGGVDSSTASHTTSITTAPTEAREDSLVSGKSPKPPAAAPSASGPRATRVNTKIVVYGPQDASSPHTQGPPPRCTVCPPPSVCLLASDLMPCFPHFMVMQSGNCVCVHACLFWVLMFELSYKEQEASFMEKKKSLIDFFDSESVCCFASSSLNVPSGQNVEQKSAA